MRQRYTTKDAEELAQLISDKPVTNKVVFSDIWERRPRASVISLEEGVMEHWHHDRICLVGDAVHKVSYIHYDPLSNKNPPLRLTGPFSMHRSSQIWP